MCIRGGGDACVSWNALGEETPAAPLGTQATGVKRRGKGNTLDLVDLGADTPEAPRLKSGIPELDRVCGGGLVRGSAILVGGDPGIGKSTLLLQLVALMARQDSRAIYVSGEEAVAQVRLRARRLGLADAPVSLAAETSLNNILDGLKAEKPDIVVIDSIQTMWSDQLAAAPGTVAQVRACSQELVRFAKQRNCIVILVGHVTKDGQIAGPKVIEHMVDTVLYFEGDRGHTYRILRAVKNLFGATADLGVLELAAHGVSAVSTPSHPFLGARAPQSPGPAVLPALPCTQPLRL